MPRLALIESTCAEDERNPATQSTRMLRSAPPSVLAPLALRHEARLASLAPASRGWVFFFDPRLHFICNRKIFAARRQINFLPRRIRAPDSITQPLWQLEPVLTTSPHCWRHLSLASWPMAMVGARLTLRTNVIGFALHSVEEQFKRHAQVAQHSVGFVRAGRRAAIFKPLLCRASST